MPRLERNIRVDIKKGKEIIAKKDYNEAKKFTDIIVASYGEFISGLFRVTASSGWGFSDNKKWLDMLEQVINVLERGIDTISYDGMGNPITPTDNENGQVFTINNTNKSINDISNNNQIDIQIKIDQMIECARKTLSSELEGEISDQVIKEALEYLDEIKEIANTKDSRGKKWSKLKNCFNWLTTQGVSVFATVTPIILKILEAE